MVLKIICLTSTNIIKNSVLQLISIDSRPYVSGLCARAGQSERHAPPAPIRTPEWSSRLSVQRLILFTQPRVKPVFFVTHLPTSLIWLWPPSCHFDLGDGDRDRTGGCSWNKPILYRTIRRELCWFGTNLTLDYLYRVRMNDWRRMKKNWINNPAQTRRQSCNVWLIIGLK